MWKVKSDDDTAQYPFQIPFHHCVYSPKHSVCWHTDMLFPAQDRAEQSSRGLSSAKTRSEYTPLSRKIPKKMMTALQNINSNNDEFAPAEHFLARNVTEGLEILIGQ